MWGDPKVARTPLLFSIHLRPDAQNEHTFSQPPHQKRDATAIHRTRRRHPARTNHRTNRDRRLRSPRPRGSATAAASTGTGLPPLRFDVEGRRGSSAPGSTEEEQQQPRRGKSRKSKQKLRTLEQQANVAHEAKSLARTVRL